MPTREAIRSGRRENFYATDNSFIDHYAREMQPTDIAVYHALERYMDWHKRSTWVGTAKIAEVLSLSQRTVQRSLRVLEDLKLIRIVRTSTMTTYFIMPVPPKGKSAATPLFDAIEEEDLVNDDMYVAVTTSPSRAASSLSRNASMVSRHDDACDALYKEERELLNETQKLNFSNQEFSKSDSVKSNFAESDSDSEIGNAARSILKGLGLTDLSFSAAVAAVESQMKLTTQSDAWNGKRHRDGGE